MPDAAALVEEVVQRILARARTAITEHGVFRIVLAGGRTPEAVYRRLADAATEWSRWQIYFGDERCLPIDDPERNSVMAIQIWLGRVPVPSSHIHAIRAELGPEAAAAAYAGCVAEARPFDMVLLGMGEDGHTASLFPGHHLDMSRIVHPVHHAPKPPEERVTLGPELLNDSEEVLILVTGRNKRAAIRRWKQGDTMPVTGIHGHRGVDVYLDAEADG
jgi:6-phosphogluconolactonase